MDQSNSVRPGQPDTAASTFSGDATEIHPSTVTDRTVETVCPAALRKSDDVRDVYSRRRARFESMTASLLAGALCVRSYVAGVERKQMLRYRLGLFIADASRGASNAVAPFRPVSTVRSVTVDGWISVASPEKVVLRRSCRVWLARPNAVGLIHPALVLSLNIFTTPLPLTPPPPPLLSSSSSSRLSPLLHLHLLLLHPPQFHQQPPPPPPPASPHAHHTFTAPPHPYAHTPLAVASS